MFGGGLGRIEFGAMSGCDFSDVITHECVI